MAEIELSVLGRQCLKRRIESSEVLASERVEDYGRRLSISRVIDNSIMASLDSGSVS